jgi:hypothetical protein
MSEELAHRAHDPEMEYERRDMRPGYVYAFLIGLAIAGILVALVLWGLYRVMDAYERSHQPPQNPLVQQATTDTRHVSPDAINKFPQPRLERNERLEINDFLLKEEQALDSYGWVDQKTGVVRIPIERAMELVAQRGLPTTPRVGAVPPAEVNVVNQAAERSDTSNQARSKKDKGQQ